MNRKVILAALMLSFIIVSIPNSVHNIPEVKAPGGELAITVGSDFTLNRNITFIDDGLVVVADNIVIDGAGYWLTGPGIGVSDSHGIYLYNRRNVTIRNFGGITAFDYGIYLLFSWYNSVYKNNAIENYIGITVVASNVTPSSGYNRISENIAWKNTRAGILLHYDSYNKVFTNQATENGRSGIELDHSNNTDIVRNNPTANGRYGIELVYSNETSIIRNSLTANNRSGIALYRSVENSIYRNNITENSQYGVYLRDSINNTIYHNNFIDNLMRQAFCENSTMNTWDNGYPSGGNYWSDNFGSATELCYDDGIGERVWAWTSPGGMFAVRFTPSMTGRLINCSYYIWSETAVYDIMIHIMDAQKRDIIEPFIRSTVGIGAFNDWAFVDMTSYGVTVSAGIDFYIGLEWTEGSKPYLNADESSPDYRSWDWNGGEWTQQLERDYMIRAVIETSLDSSNGPNQDIPGSDGIGDNPYYIEANNVDWYPFVLPLISLVSEVNGDGVVDILDIALVAIAYGSSLGDPRWNPLADLNGDGIINILDIALVAIDYGRTY